MKSAAKTEHKPHQQRDAAAGMGRDGSKADAWEGGMLLVVSIGLSKDQRPMR